MLASLRVLFVAVLGRASGYHAGESTVLLQDANVDAGDASQHPRVHIGHSVHDKRSHTHSVASKAEQHASQGVTVKYFSAVHKTVRRKTRPGEWEEGSWVRGEWMPFLGDASRQPPLINERVSWGNGNNRNGTQQKNVTKVDENTGGGLRRCGFSWDDAAAKVGSSCTLDADCMRPNTTDWAESVNYSCFSDMPNYMRGEKGECASRDLDKNSDVYCKTVCGAYPGAWCDPEKCECIKNSNAWKLGAAIQPPSEHGEASDLPHKNKKLLMRVRKEWDNMPSGLPVCQWRPHANSKCSNESQYECFEATPGTLVEGMCSRNNWFGNISCQRSCVHVRLLTPTPYYALWIPGPEAKPFMAHERIPGYEHDHTKVTPEGRGIRLQDMGLLMSNLCHSESNAFVGVTLFSPRYEEKASRLIRSCERVGICCQATMLPSNAFGPDAPEGSEAFRFETISMKPSFILSKLESTKLPVVFLDTDLEFHRFPNLFINGSWPEYPRDVLLFNYWANETRPATKNTPNCGSAVAFFNTTDNSKALLKAWAQAMAFEGNARAPDDQVLDLLLSKGEWLRRASFGWLPSSYLRTMPSFYRGVVPVIDHDHGSAPGLMNHSEAKPKMPPVKYMQLRNATDPGNEGRSLRLSADDAAKEFHDDLLAKFNCDVHGMCGQNEGDKGWVPPWADLDPTSKEYKCLVHGVCGQTKDTEETKVWGITQWDPSTVPQYKPPGTETANGPHPPQKQKTWVPEWTKMDPKSPEYACQVHGNCGKQGAQAQEENKDPASPPPPSPPISPMLDITSAEFRCKVHGECDDTPQSPQAPGRA
jgi:hypothetical protein